MIKMIHLTFVLLSIGSFLARIVLLEQNSPLMEQKVVKIGPHIISAILLLSGITLAFQTDWPEHGWLVAKVVALFAYIGFGLVAIKTQGKTRWQAFAAAILCFVYIIMVAITKQAFFL